MENSLKILPIIYSYYLLLSSVIISLIILFGGIPLVKQCVIILMQSVPSDLNLDEIESEMLKVKISVEGISGVYLTLISFFHNSFCSNIQQNFTPFSIFSQNNFPLFSHPFLKAKIQFQKKKFISYLFRGLHQSNFIKIEGVVSIHEFHVWQLSNTKVIGTVHMACDRKAEFLEVASKMKQVLHSYNVHATTIQPEFVEKTSEVPDLCVLACEPQCEENMCCTSKTITKRSVAR